MFCFPFARHDGFALPGCSPAASTTVGNRSTTSVNLSVIIPSSVNPGT